MPYELAIIGGGPAGVAAGVYAARKNIRTILLTVDFGGQSMVSDDIQNWIGTKSISGADLAKQLREHLYHYEGPNFTIQTGKKVTNITTKNKLFTLTDEGGQQHEAKTVLVTSGATRRKLDIPGAKEFEQRGVTYCATCDGPMFAGKDVAVIGGGNAAFETAIQLLAYCKTVTLIHHRNDFRADAITVNKVKKQPNFQLITNAETQEFRGDKFIKTLVYRDITTDEIKQLEIQGVFVEIGLVPSTDLVKNLIKLNPHGQIVTDPRNGRTSLAGVWAAGDCTDGLYHQNNIATGDAIKALEDIYYYLH